MRKAPSLSKAGYGILFGSCLLSAQFTVAQPDGTSNPSSERVPPKYQGFVPETGHRGVINDPDGYVNMRSGKRLDASVVAKVKAGELFSFERAEGDAWCKVKLATGKSGWMHHSRIRLFFTKDDLPAKSDEDDEIDKQARTHGVDYYEVTQGAVRGDPEARKKFFGAAEYADGAGAEEHYGVLKVVLHLIGDEALAKFLRDQPLADQILVRNSLADDNVTWPFASFEYLPQHFPKTAKIFFRREIVAWPSPDGRFAIHKVFSHEVTYSVSKVVRAEVIQKATGKALVDLTADDIGTGYDREGNVLWAPDSKRFAFLSRKTGEEQMTAYQLSGELFSKIDLPLPLAEKAGRAGEANDPELKDAVFAGENSELKTVRWTQPNVLTLETQYLYKPAGESVPNRFIYRRSEISMTIGADGKVTTDTRPIRKGE